MVKYPEDQLNFSVPSITGAQVSAPSPLIPYQPSTFPPAPKRFDMALHSTLERIFREATAAIFGALRR